MLRIALASLLFAALTAMSSTPAASGWSNETFTHGGNTWSYRLYVPDSPQDATLAVVLHGGGGSGQGICNKVDLDLDDLGEHWYIVCPSSDGGSWNVFEDPTGADDLGFLHALIADRVNEYTLNRVTVWGHSAGGMMAYTLACRYPGDTDSLVLNATTMVIDDCAPSLGVPVLYLNSDAYTYQGSKGDQNIPYTCPTVGTPCKQKKSSQPWPAGLEGAEEWAYSHNGCSGNPNETYYDDTGVNNDEADILDYPSCAYDVRIVRAEVGCHGWAGWSPRFGCKPSQFPLTQRGAEWVDGVW